jgi:MtN3 and saliva related transmembrane protein
MYSVLTIGIVCWLVYGFNLGTMPLILANAVTLVLALAILVMKLVYSRPAQLPHAKP